MGTLDQLVGLSDDLGKLDGCVEAITRKVAAYLGEVSDHLNRFFLLKECLILRTMNVVVLNYG